MNTSNTSKQETEFSFDGFGINGPLPYRKRMAAFSRAGFTEEEIQKAGNLFAAAPDLLAALERSQMALLGFLKPNQVILDAIEENRAAIAKARGQ